MAIWAGGVFCTIMVPGGRTSEYFFGPSGAFGSLRRGVGRVRSAECPISRGKGGVTEKRIVNCVTGVSG